MKQFLKWSGLLLFSILIGIVSVACSKDNDDEPDNANIYGAWIWTYFECLEKVNGEIVYQESEYVGEEEYHFYKDGSCYLRHLDSSGSGEWGRFQIAGQTLIFQDGMSIDGSDTVLTIESLTSSSMVLVYHETDTYNDGIHEEYVKYYFSKIN